MTSAKWDTSAFRTRMKRRFSPSSLRVLTSSPDKVRNLTLTQSHADSERVSSVQHLFGGKRNRDEVVPIVSREGNSRTQHDINQNRTNQGYKDSPFNPLTRDTSVMMDIPKMKPHSASSSVSSSNILLEGMVEGESMSDPFDPSPDSEEPKELTWNTDRMSGNSVEVTSNNGYSQSPESFRRYDSRSYASTRNLDIVGQTAEARFPWQHDVGVQCTILPWFPRRNASGDLSDAAAELLSDDNSSDRQRHEKTRKRTKMSDVLKGHWGCTVSRENDIAQSWRTYQEKDSFRSRTRTLTESIEVLSNLSKMKSDKPDFHSTPASPKLNRVESLKSRSKPIITRTTSAGSAPRRMHSTDDSISLDNWPASDLGERSDTLTSPRVSPIPWLRPTVPELVVTSLHGDHNQRAGITKSSTKKDNFLAVPPRRPLRRKSSGSLQSASDDSDTESSPTVPPVSRRGRRQAICDSKSLGLAPDGEISPTNSCDESEGNSVPDKTSRRGRKRSSGDLGINYPGDLLVHGRQKKVLIKRNTIADFANTKAYQGSIASLISEQDSKKKPTSSFSLIKLIQDKKAHRTKETVSSLGEILSHLKRSEFKDNNLTCYKDSHWSELIASKDKDGGSLMMDDHERKRREAVWELFISECVFLIDHLMVLKHCFMEPLKKVQVEGCLMFAEPQDLFGNLDELCYVSYTFCKDFISVLMKDASSTDFGRTEVLVTALQRFSQLTRDGEVYHEYCLNYSKAVTYMEQLRKNEDFSEFEKWCEQDARCHRLQLTDLLISPMQHCTKVPLLLTNIRRYTADPDERKHLTEALEKLDTSLRNLETKMKWLKNFERVQEIQQQIMWQPITELEPRAFIPEFLKATLTKQPCERLLASPKRQLLHEGPLTLLEINKTMDMYMLLFDDILLLTKVKKPPRKKSTVVQDSNPMSSPRVHTEGAVFVVHRQPIALDRFTIHDVRPPDAAATGLKNAFVLVQISRFQQIIGVYTLQAPSEAAKAAWMTRLHDAQKQYKAALRRTDSVSSSTVSFDTVSVNTETDTTSDSAPNVKPNPPKDPPPSERTHKDSTNKDSPVKDFIAFESTDSNNSVCSNGPNLPSPAEKLLAKNLSALNIQDPLTKSNLSDIPLQAITVGKGIKMNSLESERKTDIDIKTQVSSAPTGAGILMTEVTSQRRSQIHCAASQNGEGQGQSDPASIARTTATLNRIQRLNLLKVIHEKSHSKDSLDVFDPVYI